jgi:hypothetical protein
MKKGWKVVIGIVLGLVVLVVLVGACVMSRHNLYGARLESLDSRGYSERGPGMMFTDGFGPQMHGFGRMGYGTMPFIALFGGLFRLGFLALAVLGTIWLVKRMRTPKAVEAVAVAPAVVAAPCKKCGKPVQDDWKNCPFCGRKV